MTFYASVIDLHGLLGVAGALDVFLDICSIIIPFRGRRGRTPVRTAVVPATVEQGNKVSERNMFGTKHLLRM